MFWNQMSTIEHIIAIASYCVFAWICLETVICLIARKRLKVTMALCNAYWHGYNEAKADVSKLQETSHTQYPSTK
jgi:hypothetical protein